MATVNIYDMAQTWNAGATTFTAIKMNVTDTASAAGSLLMDLQVGGVSRFGVRKDGALLLGAGTTGIKDQNGNIINFYSNTLSAPSLVHLSGSLRLRSDTGAYMWGSGDDAQLHRDAANTLAQRNGTNAQAFRVYNTYTDASNYERARLAWVGNDLQFGTEFAGTGASNRQLHIYGNGPIRFFTGSTPVNRWDVSATGHFIAAVDNTYDIGASGANRPRDIHVGRDLKVAGRTHVSVVATASLPAAGATEDGRVLIEDNGAGDRNIVFYAGGERFRIDGGAAI